MAPRKDSFYLRALRTKIGEGLRSQYELGEPLTGGLADLLMEMDDQDGKKQIALENIGHQNSKSEAS
jgi:hypothetical protein